MATTSRIILCLAVLKRVALGQSAKATFEETGLEGSVKVINGHILLDVLISSDFDWTQLDHEDASSCLEEGLYFGIYETWSSTSDSNLGDSCSSDNTGYRWDPWLACSSLSSNDYCLFRSGCVAPGSSIFSSDESVDPIYSCNEYVFESNPYLCEMGDWSGKYGMLSLDESDGSYSVETSFSSAFEADASDLIGRSVVFRCGDNSRAFCAGFDEYEPSDEETESYPERAYQETNWSEDETEAEEEDNVYSMRAVFGDNSQSFVLLTYYNFYNVSIWSGDLGIPAGCGDELYYYIYSGWDETGPNCSIKTGGYKWDPTVTCLEGTQQTELCEDEDLLLCEDEDWTYVCDGSDDIACAASDLSGRYGSVWIAEQVSFGFFESSGWDDRMPPMKMLEGASLVVECSNGEIITCAPFEEYYDDVGLVWGSSDSDSSSGGSGGSGLGTSETVILVVAVIGVAALIPLVKTAMTRWKTERDEVEKTRAETGRAGTAGTAGRRGGRGRDVESGGRTGRGPSENVSQSSRKGSVGRRNRTMPSMQQGGGY